MLISLLGGAVSPVSGVDVAFDGLVDELEAPDPDASLLAE
jgi:hypothetical protein